jgi:hypothetical protein
MAHINFSHWSGEYANHYVLRMNINFNLRAEWGDCASSCVRLAASVHSTKTNAVFIVLINYLADNEYSVLWRRPHDSWGVAVRSTCGRTSLSLAESVDPV